MKAILFDIDGVLIHYDMHFSQTLSSEKFPNASAILDSYFKSDSNLKCDKGSSSPYREIAPHLAKIGWQGTPEEYLAGQWNWEKTKIDYELLAEIRKIRNGNQGIFIASNQNSFRQNFLKNAMNLQDIFDKCFFSCEIGYVKKEQQYWDYVIGDLGSRGIARSDIVFFDDLDVNIEIAAKNGINGKLINSRASIWGYVKELIGASA